MGKVKKRDFRRKDRKRDLVEALLALREKADDFSEALFHASEELSKDKHERCVKHFTNVSEELVETENALLQETIYYVIDMEAKRWE